MSIPRGLSAEEQAAWARLASSVTPMPGRKRPKLAEGATSAPAGPQPQPKPAKPKPAPPKRAPASAPPPRSARRISNQLDGHWDRKLKLGDIAPDYTLDLHGHSLDAAYDRVMSGVDQARAMQARVVLVIAGRDRGADPADRGSKRGAIRAKLLDWLAASHHADAIAAVRRAHIRHGGEGALYLVLRRGG